jgi:hypothetical protein
LRNWLVPAIFVGLAAVLTVPWSFWVIAAAYDRDESEKSALLAERVRIQLFSTWWWISPQNLLNLMRGELLGDNAVQAVTFLYVRNDDPSKADAYGYVRRPRRLRATSLSGGASTWTFPARSCGSISGWRTGRCCGTS